MKRPFMVAGVTIVLATLIYAQLPQAIPMMAVIAGAASLNTVGSIPFVNSAGSVTQDSALFWDNSNKRLGVGTQSPAAAIDTTGRVVQAGAAAITGYMHTNSGGAASGSSLNPGLLVSGSLAGTGAFYGMDLGWNSTLSRYRNRQFIPTSGDFSIATVATSPTQQSNFTDLVYVRGDTGNMHIASGTVIISTAATPASAGGGRDDGTDRVGCVVHLHLHGDEYVAEGSS